MTADATSTPSPWDAARWLMVGGLIVMALGLVLAWAKAGPFSATGIDTDDGKLFGLLLLAGGAAVWAHELGKVRWWVPALVGVALLAFAVYEIGDVSSHETERDDDPATLEIDLDVSPGVGLWLDAVGAAALTFGAAVAPKWRAGQIPKSS